MKMTKLETRVENLFLEKDSFLKIIRHPKIEEINDWPWKKKRSKKKLENLCRSKRFDDNVYNVEVEISL